MTMNGSKYNIIVFVWGLLLILLIISLRYKIALLSIISLLLLIGFTPIMAKSKIRKYKNISYNFRSFVDKFFLKRDETEKKLADYFESNNKKYDKHENDDKS